MTAPRDDDPILRRLDAIEDRAWWIEKQLGVIGNWIALAISLAIFWVADKTFGEPWGVIALFASAVLLIYELHRGLFRRR